MADWNDLASDNYSAANLLVQEEHDRSGVSRAYYAAYSRVTGALKLCGGVVMPIGREGPAHAKAPEFVEKHLTALGRKRWQLSSLLRTLYTMRRAADYQPSAPVGNADGRMALLLMSEVFKLTKEVF